MKKKSKNSNNIFNTFNKNDVEKRLSSIEKILQYEFCKKSDIHAAIIHPGLTKQKDHLLHFERLEFLGDRVLGFIIAKTLYNTTNYCDGELAIGLAKMTSTNSLIQALKKTKIIDHLYFPHDFYISESKTSSGIADMCEAILGAIFLDSNIDIAGKFIENTFIIDSAITKDYKSTLQEYAQKIKAGLPVYEVINITGDQHDPIFEICVRVGENSAHGFGENKKKAQQNAAQNLCKELSNKLEHLSKKCEIPCQKGCVIYK